MATKLESDLNKNLQFFSGLVILAVLAAGYYYLMPGIKSKAAEVRQLSAQKVALDHDIAALQTAKQQVALATAKFEIDMDRINRVYPDFEQMPELYLQMEKMSALMPSHLKFKYQLGQPTSDKDGVRISVNLTATGSYADLKTLITTMEETIRPITFSQLSFSPPGAVEGSTVQASGVLNLIASGYVRANALSSAYSTSTSSTR